MEGIKKVEKNEKSMKTYHLCKSHQITSAALCKHEKNCYRPYLLTNYQLTTACHHQKQLKFTYNEMQRDRTRNMLLTKYENKINIIAKKNRQKNKL